MNLEDISNKLGVVEGKIDGFGKALTDQNARLVEAHTRNEARITVLEDKLAEHVAYEVVRRRQRSVIFRAALAIISACAAVIAGVAIVIEWLRP